MALDLKLRWIAYTEIWGLLACAVWCFVNQLAGGLKGVRDRSFASWYETLGHNFAKYEGAATPVPHLVALASGCTLELGPGTGNQLPRFDISKLTRVYGIEPNSELLATLRTRLQAYHELAKIYLPLGLSLEDQIGLEAHGIADGSLDTIVCMQVMCSMPDPSAAAKRMYRLLRPGGQLLFWEHCGSNDQTTNILQYAWTLVWSPLVGGCRLTADIEKAVLGAGSWRVEEKGRDEVGPYNLMPRTWGRFVKVDDQAGPNS